MGALHGCHTVKFYSYNVATAAPHATSLFCSRDGVGSSPLSVWSRPSHCLVYFNVNGCSPSLPRVTVPIRGGLGWVASPREVTLYSFISGPDSASSTVAGWATSWGWPSLRTGFVLLLAGVFLFVFTVLATRFLFPLPDLNFDLPLYISWLLNHRQ